MECSPALIQLRWHGDVLRTADQAETPLNPGQNLAVKELQRRKGLAQGQKDVPWGWPLTLFDQDGLG